MCLWLPPWMDFISIIFYDGYHLLENKNVVILYWQVPLPISALSLLLTLSLHIKIGGLCLFQTLVKLLSQVKLQLKHAITWAIQVPTTTMKVLGRPILQEIPLEHGVLNLGITPYPQKSQRIHITTRLMKHEKVLVRGKQHYFMGWWETSKAWKREEKGLLSTYKQHAYNLLISILLVLGLAFEDSTLVLEFS